MRAILAAFGVAALLLVGAISLGLIHVQQTREARLPDANGKGGQAPAFKTEVSNVSVGAEEKTVKLPTVSLKDTRVVVPTIKVAKPAGTTTTETAAHPDAPKNQE
ncbi:MAG: hypothetical protein ACRCSO_08650 [Sphingomonas sp.]